MEVKTEDKTLKNRWRILAVILVGTFMATLDSSIVNVALPVMARHLSVGIDSIQWVVTSYLIVISAFIVIFGKIADRRGKSVIFLQGYAVFCVGSLLCGVSTSLGFLVFARIFQAIGASMFMSSSQGIIASVFPPTERGRALGLSGTIVALGTMLGPVVGGIMVEYLNWQSIFLINVPIAIAGYIAGWKLLPRKETVEMSSGFDIRGAILFVIAIVALFWSVLRGEDLGWGNITVVAGFVLSGVCIFLFVYFEKKTSDPLLDFSIFGNKLFTVSLLCGFISFIAIFSMNIIHPFYLQYIFKASPAQAGLLMIVSPICVGVVAPLSGYLSDRIGSELLTCAGLTLTAAGLVLTGFLTADSGYADIILRIALIGIGNGMFQSPNNSLIMSTVQRDKLGIAGSINALIRNLGMVSGIAFSIALLYNRMSYKIGYKVTSFVEGQNQAFLYGMKVVYITAAVICVAGIVLTAARIARKKKLLT